MGFILGNELRVPFETFLQKSDTLNRYSKSKCFHVVFKSVIDEISSVLSTNLGYLIQDMSKELQKIIPEKDTALTMSELKALLEYMDGLENRFEKLSGLIKYIKKTFLDPDNFYYSLVDLKSRRKKFEEILELKNSFDIGYFSIMFGNQFNYYDPTEEFIDFEVKKDFEKLINEIFLGSRSRRNTYDKIHLYSCCLYSKRNNGTEVKFVTNDKIILKGSQVLSEYFQILDIQGIIQILEKEILNI